MSLSTPYWKSLVDPKKSLPQSADSLIRPDDRAEAEPDSDGNALTSAEVRQRYANLEVRVDEAKGEAAEAKTLAAQAMSFAKEARDATVSLTAVVEERFAMLFTDLTTLMGSGIRVEKCLDALKAQNVVIDDRLTTTIVKVERLTGETDANADKIRASQNSIRAMANDVRSTQTRLAEKAAADKMDRVRMEERFAAMKSDITELKKDVSASGQHAAVAESFARKSLESVDEISGIFVEEKREERVETREIKKEKREDKRHLWKWALGLVGALAIAGASYALKAYLEPPHLPALPAGVHS